MRNKQECQFGPASFYQALGGQALFKGREKNLQKQDEDEDEYDDDDD